MEEYPFADKVTVSDKFILEDRLHPEEVRQNAEQVKAKIDKYNENRKEIDQQNIVKKLEIRH